MLDRRHLQAIHLLLMGETQEKAAEVCKVHPATIIKWRRTPMFQQEYDRQLAQWEEDLRDVRLASPKARMQAAQADHDRLSNLGRAEVSEHIAAIRTKGSLRQEIQGEMAILRPREGVGQVRPVEGSFEVDGDSTPAEALAEFGRYLYHVADAEGAMDLPVRELIHRLGGDQPRQLPEASEG